MTDSTQIWRSFPVSGHPVDDPELTRPVIGGREKVMKKVAGLRAKLTKTTIDKIVPPSAGKIIVWDADQAGFGVAVTAQGVKSWIINYRNRRQWRLGI